MNTMGRHTDEHYGQKTDEHYGQTHRRTLWADRQKNTMGRWMKDRHRTQRENRRKERQTEHYGQDDRNMWADREEYGPTQTNRQTDGRANKTLRAKRQKNRQGTVVRQTNEGYDQAH